MHQSSPPESGQIVIIEVYEQQKKRITSQAEESLGKEVLCQMYAD